MMMTLEYLRQILDYNPETGEMIWKKRELRPGLERIDKGWNTRFAGKPAGRPHRHGHLQVNISYLNYSAHRLAWWLYHGEQPPSDLDHENGKPADNRIDNLRLCTKSQNAWNAKIRVNNTSGVKGVSWSKKSKAWYAYITMNGKMRSIGRFKTIEEAAAARAEAADRLHGEFARKF